VTRNAEVLPLRDVLLYDVGRQNQQFGLDLGMVCYS